MMGIEYFPIKKRFSRKAVCGYNIKIVDENGTEAANEEGYVVLQYHYHRNLY
jgi:propionyl-CoA synthetase